MAEKYTVAIIGCGRLGQHYAEVYQSLPNTELVAIAEYNPERRKVVGERFGITALYEGAQDLFRRESPDISVVVLPGKYIKEAVIASAQAGVKGVSTDKPIAARLSDVDAMVEECQKRGAVFAGGNLQRAMGEVQQAAHWLRAGDYGELRGASVHGWGGEISGGGCQHIAVLRLFTQAEITEVVAWGHPQEALERADDEDLIINGHFQLTNGLSCPVFGQPTPSRGVDILTDDALVRWDWAPPTIFQGRDQFHDLVRFRIRHPPRGRACCKRIYRRRPPCGHVADGWHPLLGLLAGGRAVRQEGRPGRHRPDSLRYRSHEDHERDRGPREG